MVQNVLIFFIILAFALYLIIGHSVLPISRVEFEKIYDYFNKISRKCGIILNIITVLTWPLILVLLVLTEIGKALLFMWEDIKRV